MITGEQVNNMPQYQSNKFHDKHYRWQIKFETNLPILYYE